MVLGQLLPFGLASAPGGVGNDNEAHWVRMAPDAVTHAEAVCTASAG